MKQDGIHLLLALAGLKQANAQNLVNSLIQADVPIIDYEIRDKKITIQKYLNSHPETNVVIVSEVLEWTAPFTTKDFEDITKGHEQVLFIPILQNEQIGTDYITELFHMGLYNALFSKDTDISLLATLIKNNRARKDALLYYNIKDVVHKERTPNRSETDFDFTVSNDDKRKNFDEMESSSDNDISARQIRKIVIGVIGTKSGIGSTFFSIMIARYLAQYGKKVAVIECGKKKAFAEMEVDLDVEEVNDDIFRYKTVTFIKNKLNIQADLESYDVIINDYGAYQKSRQDEYLDSTEFFLIAGGMPWETNLLRYIVNDFMDDSAMHVFVRGTDKWIKEKLERSYCVFSDAVTPFEGQIDQKIQQILENYILSDSKNPNAKLGSNKEDTFRQVILNNLYIKDSIKLNLLSKLGKNKADDKNKEEEKVRRIGGRKKISMTGSCSIFVTSIKSGCGSTHVSATLANYLLDKGDTCLVTKNRDIEQDLSSDLDVETNFMRIDSAFAEHQNVVIDCGVYTRTDEKMQSECRRAAMKVMVCWGGTDNLKKLAEFIIREKKAAKDWVYIFNNVHEDQIKEIKKLMTMYTVCFLPTYSFNKIPYDVVKVCETVLSR